MKKRWICAMLWTALVAVPLCGFMGKVTSAIGNEEELLMEGTESEPGSEVQTEAER